MVHLVSRLLAGAALSGVIAWSPVALAQSAPVVSRPVVQALPSGDQTRLNSALSRLGRNPRDVYSLIEAGDAARGMQDFAAAIGFYRRAEEVDPNNARAKAGLASAFTLSGDPVSAIPMFERAEKAGAAANAISSDRGLAYDLVGDNATAQRYYSQALLTSTGAAADELRTRLSVSQAIAGDKDTSYRTLLPLLNKQDKPGWRTRAFTLAIAGETTEAIAVAGKILPAPLSTNIAPYLRYMPRLTKAQQSAAANLGRFPRASEIGHDDSRLAAFAPPSSTAAGSALIPKGTPLGSGTVRVARTNTSRTRTPTAATRANVAPERVAPPEIKPTIERDGGELPPISRAGVPAPVTATAPVTAAAPARVAATTSGTATPAPMALPSIPMATPTAVRTPQTPNQPVALAPWVAPSEAIPPEPRTTPVGQSRQVVQPKVRPADVDTSRGGTMWPRSSPRSTPSSNGESSHVPEQPGSRPVVQEHPHAAPSTVATQPLAAGSQGGQGPAGQAVPHFTATTLTPPAESTATATRSVVSSSEPEAGREASQALPLATSPSPLLTTPPAAGPAWVATGPAVPASSAEVAATPATLATSAMPARTPATSAMPASEPTEMTLAEIFADLGKPKADAVPISGAVDIRKITPAAPPLPPVITPVPMSEATKSASETPAVANAARNRRAEMRTAPSASARTPAATRAEAARAKAAEAAKAKAQKPEPPAHPSRIWVQIGVGRNKAAIEFDWRRFNREAPAVFRGREAYISEMGRTNRVVVGPFASQREAMAFIADAKKQGINDALPWVSALGQAVNPL